MSINKLYISQPLIGGENSCSDVQEHERMKILIKMQLKNVVKYMLKTK